MTEFNAALALDPKNARALAGRGFATLHKGGDMASADKDFVTVIDLVAGLEDESSKKLRGGAFYNRGLIADVAGDDVKARAFYQASYGAFPTPTVGAKLKATTPK